ncbi:DNA-binding protein [Capnocytophaga leadbetteri]|uniref:DNA-binding protein n=1 Tax=Capnocytophaga leadbetteri TaxID=327575 RepID=UPI0028E8F7E5|nr:DNA-binding protein [Capnocytophaga leadbetteri]
MDKKDLTTSTIERQNILNNRFAIETIQEKLAIEGMLFEGEYRYTKKMVADFYGVEERTIERYLETHSDELKHNGYILCKGKLLKEFKLRFAPVINIGSKTTQLGLFNFRSFLNIGMLLTDSEQAKKMRSFILDIVITTINEKTGGGTKFINLRDINYYPAAIQEDNYRRVLTSSVKNYVSGHQTYKYAQVTDLIYRAVFKENAKEYREILKLDTKDNVRHTLYSEVLLVLSSFENGVGVAIKETYEKTGILLTMNDVEAIVNQLLEHPMQKPYLNDARSKMASRDFSFRDAFHSNIAEYLRAVTPEEFERFIGDQSVDFDTILEGNKDVLERLK